MVRVAALTSGHGMPSARYRVRQYISPLKALGVNVREFCPSIDKWKSVPGKPESVTNRQILPLYAAWQAIKLTTRLPGLLGSYGYDITWLNKELLPGYLTFELLLHRPLVFDIDDAIWLTTPWGARATEAIAKRSELVIAGNAYLANRLERIAKRVVVIPTAVDSNLYRPRTRRDDDAKRFTLGWIGSSSNFCYLARIEEALSTFCKQHSDCRFLVVADRAPPLSQFPPGQLVFETWNEATAHTLMQEMDVGLMPLDDSEWTRGKCSMKMLQYMSCGIPVVVSPVGMNQEVLQMGDVGIGANSNDAWREALEYFYGD